MSAKNKILDAALRLFTAQSCNATTVSCICESTQVFNGSFFHAFSSKDDLAAPLYLRILQSYHARLITILNTKPAALAGIKLLIETHLCWVVEEKPQAIFLF